MGAGVKALESETIKTANYYFCLDSRIFYCYLGLSRLLLFLTNGV